MLKRFAKKCWQILKVYYISLFYNDFCDFNYAADICMEPMFWLVNNFACVLGPMFVVGVCCLTTSVVGIAYWIGLPYWWKRNPMFTIFLLITGNWLLVNNVFHYYMAVKTMPGYPPQDQLVHEAVSICKKCIAPKPPRTHHCSVCNRCILKMDHHCPWLNNCVGHYNHRYFFLYMIYTILGVLFIIIFGIDLALVALWHATPDSSPDVPLYGHPVQVQGDSNEIIPLSHNSVLDEEIVSFSSNDFHDDYIEAETVTFTHWERRSIIYMTLLNLGVLIALGGLSLWHARLISRGETSIESNINKSETQRLAMLNFKYVNPYDFGRRENWKYFLGLTNGRTFLRHVLLPSSHKPIGNGLRWRTVATYHEKKSVI